MKRIWNVLILLIGVSLAACGGSSASTGASVAQEGQPLTSAGAPVSAPAVTSAPAAAAPAAAAPAAERALDASGNAVGGTAANAPAQQQQSTDRLVIKTAQLSLQVDNVNQTEAAVRAKVAALNGYIVQVQTNGTDDDMSANIVFRVPQERFNDALTGVEGLAKKVLGRTLGGEDVTEEFVDLTSRLKNLEATRDRLTTFLNKAEKVEDALQVNQALTDVQGQIEQIQGRMKFLTQSAAMSTITVSLQPVPALPPIVQQEGWQPSLVARNALRGLLAFGQGFANVVIVLVIWSPVWVLLGLAGWWLFRRARPVTTRSKESRTA